MYEYDEECLKSFLEKQLQLFDEPVAETLEEARTGIGGLHGSCRGFSGRSERLF